MFDQFKQQLPDIDPVETREWIESLDAVAERSGRTRAQFLLYKVLKRARMLNVGVPPTTQTRYINTISPEQEPDFPGDEEMERRIRRLIRWNAAAMVVRGNRRFEGLGGHLSTYASAATLLEVGFNHFFRGKDHAGGGDQIYFQGHAAPGIYARAFLEGRFHQQHLDYYRRETTGKGLSSYPHPRLMPEFWEFPTVSMGLGPINAIYQAKFNRYLHARGLKDTSNQHVWAFLGDGETDEPESLGALSLAAREGLDNLIFVVNCNLQRLDGPVRGNGKIIQELESVFRGAGWNVVKVIWGREWDAILSRDTEGELVQKMMDTLDGEYQRFTVEGGPAIREDFFDTPGLQKMIEGYTDDDLAKLRRGGHDYRKVYAAYKAAVESESKPTVVLAKTVKGWALGGGVAGRNVTHQKKKLEDSELRVFRDLLELPITDEQLQEVPFHHPGADAPEIEYMLERRRALGGLIPTRNRTSVVVKAPVRSLYDEFLQGTKKKAEASTTMAFVRLLRKLMKSEEIGPRVVPIVPDEARTFGMDPLFAEFGIYAAQGQKYTPVDAEYVLKYHETKDGQLIEEGITEAGSLAEFTAASTAYSTHGEPMVPFFMFYSMFGFQRVGDLIWSCADQRGRGFLVGATAGRTTLTGEGLQHDDGQSHVQASVVPSLCQYDPAFAYESAVIVREGLRRMLDEEEDILYYITLYNENYVQPAMPEGADEGIVRGLYLYQSAPTPKKLAVRLLGSGPMLNGALRAAELLGEFEVAADVWSVPSYGELRREAMACERWNRLHPGEPAKVPYVTRCLGEDGDGPVVAATDYMKAVPHMIAPYITRDFHALGTDGFGRSGTREELRRFFENDAEHIAITALSALARQGKIRPKVVTDAMKKWEIDPEAPDPALPEHPRTARKVTREEPEEEAEPSLKG
jgi:pyruvate dehydrogenase E1 component